jgi:DNA processing protein
MNRDEDILNLLALLAVPGIGSLRARKLLVHFKNPCEIFQAGTKEIAEVARCGISIAENLKRPDFVQAEKELKKAQEIEARIVALEDNNYPPLLKEIYDPPLLLFVQGELPDSGEKCFAIVGTRSPSDYGNNQAQSIASGLARQGLVIVSGMARGIDSASHRGALEAGGKTVAVLGCGLDITYPTENKRLRDRIANQGAVITEFFFGVTPEPSNFPRRNRIISGMSLGTLIVEAGDTSGALITAALAYDQNREVFALPGDVTRLQSRGCNRLIRTDWARLVTSENDILEALQVQLDLKLEKSEPLPLNLSPDLNAIYNILNTKPQYIDDIAHSAGMNPSEVLTILLQLEMDNLIRSLPGKYYVKV